MMIIYLVYKFLFICSLLMFLILYNQVFMTLMSLEFVMLSVLMIISMKVMVSMNLILILYYITMVVCESVLGLTLMIYLVRNFGNDSMFFMNLMLW